MKINHEVKVSVINGLLLLLRSHTLSRHAYYCTLINNSVTTTLIGGKSYTVYQRRKSSNSWTAFFVASFSCTAEVVVETIYHYAS